jgi:hypothetical protein
MSLNMYLAETDAQVQSMNAICKETIQGMENAIRSIDRFRGSIVLRGKSYDSAKSFMAQTHRPLAQGIIYLCEELIRQNTKYPNSFRSEVAATDVVEQEVMAQIQQLDKLIRETEELQTTIPLIGSTANILYHLKHNLENKLNRLHTFNASSSSNYETAMELAASVTTGIAELQGGNGFNSASGTFSTEGMNLDWASKIEDIHYTQKAEEQYAEYLNEHPDQLDKVIEIVKYEEQNPEYVEQTNEFLSPLEEQDVVEIKFMMYTAEEPYRTLTLHYLDRFEITSTTDSGVFYPSDNAITFNVEDDRVNDRGAYFTFFHEMGHAIDYYSGVDQGMDGYFTDSFTMDGNNLADEMYNDVENRVRMELEAELSQGAYQDLNEEDKTSMVNNIADAFIYRGPSDFNLTSEEEALYDTIQEEMSNELRSDAHHNASDIYGGATVNEIIGKWGHHDSSYWIDGDGERVREPNLEGFASYYGSIMLKDSEFRDEQLESVGEYLPESREFMDEIFESMNEGVNE